MTFYWNSTLLPNSLPLQLRIISNGFLLTPLLHSFIFTHAQPSPKKGTYTSAAPHALSEPLTPEIGEEELIEVRAVLARLHQTRITGSSSSRTHAVPGQGLGLVNICTEDGYTPLLLAAMSLNLVSVRKLLERGASCTHVTPDFQRTAGEIFGCPFQYIYIYIYCQLCKNYRCVGNLGAAVGPYTLKLFAPCNFSLIHPVSITQVVYLLKNQPFFYACTNVCNLAHLLVLAISQSRQFEMVSGRLMGVLAHLTCLGCDMNARDVYGLTVLHIACGLGAPVQLINWLLNLGVNPTILDNVGMTPLHCAAAFLPPQKNSNFPGLMENNLNTIQRLLAEPSRLTQLSIRDTLKGFTVLHWCLALGKSKVRSVCRDVCPWEA